MLSFCVRRSRDQVLDPSCGTGAFLVRAFARKRELEGAPTAAELVGQIHGVDSAELPARLASHNLAVRGGGAIPRVHARDFFSIEPGDEGGPVPALDAVVGNPPWVQQESLAQTKHRLGAQARAAGCELSRRSDLHAYFWPHAARFLRPGGRLGLVTSAQWLDADYGDALRRWLADRFDVEAIIDSVAEPWFPTVRVDSVVTILRRRVPKNDRRPPARLVRLRRPLTELLANDGGTAAACRVADTLRDAIEHGDRDRDGERFRLRIVDQGALGDRPRPRAWGAMLRRPAIWDQLREATPGRWVALGERCEVRRGITSGCDGYFYLRDMSEEWLARHPQGAAFRAATGLPRAAVAGGSLRLVEDRRGGTPIPLDAASLMPAVHGPLELDRPRLDPTSTRRRVLWVGDAPHAQLGDHTARYLRDGEARGISRRPTCVARTSAQRPWFDLTRPRRPGLLWTKERQFRHLVALNADAVVPNCRLYEVIPGEAGDLLLWGGLLHSSWGLLSCLVHGRPLGSEAIWSTMVGEARGMAVPDPERAAQDTRQRVAEAYDALADRPVAPMLPGPDGELERADRRALDDAVLQLLGVSSAAERRRWAETLYAHLGRHFARLRRKEERAVAHRYPRPQRR